LHYLEVFLCIFLKSQLLLIRHRDVGFHADTQDPGLQLGNTLLGFKSFYVYLALDLTRSNRLIFVLRCSYLWRQNGYASSKKIILALKVIGINGIMETYQNLRTLRRCAAKGPKTDKFPHTQVDRVNMPLNSSSKERTRYQLRWRVSHMK
jgi:hypothetical protein